MDESHFDNLIKSLYSALVRPTGFNEFLSKLIKSLNLLSGSIVMVNKPLETANIIWVEGLDISGASLFISDHEKQDPLMARLQKKPPGELITMGDYEAQQTQMSHPEFFLHLNNDLDIYYAAGVVLADDKLWSSLLFFHRSKNQGEFSFDECILLEKLIPHIQHAMQLYHLKLQQDKQYILTDLLFDQIQQPVILLDESGYVCHCNKQAELFLTQHRYLKKINASLHWANARNDQQIQKVTNECLKDHSTRHLHLKSPCGTSVTLSFVPLVHVENRIDSGIAVFIYTQNEVELNIQVLCELYDLSKKEGLVCCGLVNGRSPAEIAQAQYLSYETVRTYIKRIMKKTQTNRQNELVAKVLSGPASLLLRSEH
ncbi:helix-turn-helix transcriptional regulator [Psychromonas ossibalaenae]|uniref:helix-turn-helix transcriptional regulator n=1 Tax=Psychromonas ossibalaenae TaxID=444922 RepID=UPI00035EB2C5|nr:helix-turn-helix transcriptional regulator [Psychromonas ossibalaenae]